MAGMIGIGIVLLFYIVCIYTLVRDAIDPSGDNLDGVCAAVTALTLIFAVVAFNI